MFRGLSLLFLVTVWLSELAIKCSAQELFWGNSVEGISVGLMVSNSAYELDKPIFVTVHVRNDSTAPNHIAVQPLECFLSFIATDETRKQLRAKPAPTEISGIGGFPLPPGAVHLETVDLQNYLFLTNAGKIVLTVKWLVERTTFALSDNAVVEIVSAATPTGNEEIGIDPARSTSKNAFAAMVASDVTAPSAAQGSPLFSKSTPVVAPQTTAHFRSGQKTGAVLVAGLSALLLIVLWRALRRKPRL